MAGAWTGGRATVCCWLAGGRCVSCSCSNCALVQVPAPLMLQRSATNGPNSSSSFQLMKEMQAAGGVFRTVVPMKSTVMKLAVNNRQQVGLDRCLCCCCRCRPAAALSAWAVRV